MGDEAKLPSDEIPAGKDVTIDELVAFFGRYGAVNECPICKTNEWSFPGRDGGGVVYLQNLPSTGPVTAVSAYLMICNNCYFIRLHAKKVIDQSLEVIREKVADGK